MKNKMTAINFFVLIFVMQIVLSNGFLMQSHTRPPSLLSTRAYVLDMAINNPFVSFHHRFIAKPMTNLEDKKRISPFEYLRRAIKRGRLALASSLMVLMFSLGQVAKASPSGSSTHRNPASKSAPIQQTCREQLVGVKKTAIVKIETSSNSAAIKSNEKLNSKPLSIVADAFSKDSVVSEVQKSLQNLADSISGAKLDTLILLIVTSTIIPLFKTLNISPIIGFLMTGTLLGPTGLNWVKDVHMIDHLGELGIVFFLFEMGLELSLEKLTAMKKDVFGLGTSQFLVTSAVGAAIAKASGLSGASSIAIGGSLALSSSAFVLQLLKDKGAMGTRHGKASFGILLLQDLAVVPLLIVVELLGKGGSGMGRALIAAGVKAFVALSTMSILGRKLLDPIFTIVAKSGSQEAFLSVILTTVLLMSFVTQGIGLSNTLGAFLAGLLLAETRYHYQIEADIAPFRGLLLGFFFIDVGFSIDIQLLIKEAPKIFLMLITLLAGKAGIITLLSMAFGVPFASAQQAGLLNAQAGEFAFVAFGIAERLGLLSPQLTKILLTTVALSMAATPALGELGSFISNKLDEKAGMSRYVGKDSSAVEVKSTLAPDNFVFVCGYGRVGKMVCDMLDTKFVRYAAIDNSAEKAIEARNKGLPVFYGDINRPEVMKSFDVGSAMACVVTIDDMTATNKAVISIRKSYPDLPLIIRAKDSQHKRRLETMFDNIHAMSPALPEDSVLLTLPFGGAVLQKIGVSKPEIEAIIESFRKSYMEDFEGDEFDFLDAFNRRLPPSVEEEEVEGQDEEIEKEVEIVLKPPPEVEMEEDLQLEPSGLDANSQMTEIEWEKPIMDELAGSEVGYDKDGRPFEVPSSPITFQ